MPIGLVRPEMHRRIDVSGACSRAGQARLMIRVPAGNLFISASAIGGSCKFLQVVRRHPSAPHDSCAQGI